MSTTTADAATTAVDPPIPATTTPEKPVRKFPPPCWTQEESLVLIQAYREKWYSLRRGYLRTADWDAVAAEVAERFPGASPPKTSAQCRHKIEKLRQRYRAEKQKAQSHPYPGGRFVSTWFFFPTMDAMENGTTPPSKPGNSPDPSHLEPVLDQNMLKLKLKSKNSVSSSPDFGLENGFKAKNSFSKFGVLSQQARYLDLGDDKDEEEVEFDEDHDGFRTQFRAMNGNSSPFTNSKAMNPGKYFEEPVNTRGFHLNPSMNQDMFPPSLRVNKFGKLDRSMDAHFDGSEDFGVKAVPEGIPMIPGHRGKYGGMNGFDRSSMEARSMNGLGSRLVNGSKRARDPMDEMVESIKLLGEGFVKMEKAKMEMAKEMERTRMEMEMKRNEMILESQRQMLDAFVNGMSKLGKNKKTKVKTDTDLAPEE